LCGGDLGRPTTSTRSKGEQIVKSTKSNIKRRSYFPLILLCVSILSLSLVSTAFSTMAYSDPVNAATLSSYKPPKAYQQSSVLKSTQPTGQTRSPQESIKQASSAPSPIPISLVALLLILLAAAIRRHQKTS